MSKIGLVNELHKPARKSYTRRHVTIKGLHDLWQADLVEMLPYSRINKGFKYILTCINTFSKYGFTEALRSKTGKEVTSAMERIIKRAGVPPKHLQTDMGKEFYNHTFSTLMKKYGINHYSTYSALKASICERWNRTLKTKMWKEFSLQGNYKWLLILPRIVSNYNHSRHRTIGMSPADVTKDKESLLLNTVYAGPKLRVVPSSHLQIGDHVRISKQKYVFRKGYQPNWTTEVFQIRLIQPTLPSTFLLEDLSGNPISGSFYKEELQKTKNHDVYLIEKIIKRKKNMIYVKWLGFPKPTWINETDIISK